MYFKATFRNHPELDPFYPYYLLVESYGNIDDKKCHKTILYVGFVLELKPEQLNAIQKKLTQLACGTVNLFLEEDSVLDSYVTRFWNQILANKTIDVGGKSKAINLKTWVDLDLLTHKLLAEPCILFQNTKPLDGCKKIRPFVNSVGIHWKK